jgi:hypothetical protein
VTFALCAASVGAADMAAELDCIVKPQLLDRYFARYGHVPTKTIVREQRIVRFRLPAVAKGVGQTGLYSYFALAGDFEVSAAFEVVAVPTPQKGYGASCGIGLDTDGPDGSVGLQWQNQKGRVPAFGVVRGIPLKERALLDWNEVHYHPTKAKTGKLVLRREKADLICLVSENLRDQPREIFRVPFTQATVRKLRLYADSGGSPTSVDARLGNIVIKAEEITGGIPLRERPSNWWWWLIFLTLVALAVAGLVIRRRQQMAEDED